VFVEEQDVSLAADRDGRDGQAVHLVAVRDGTVVGTCRLLADGEVVRLGRMVVHPALRGRSLGARLLELADERALDLGARRILLHAQVPSRGVYDRAGYVQQGEPFTEEGIEHVTMEKTLA
jgi:predicted GNAT family N-acyltransferase